MRKRRPIPALRKHSDDACFRGKRNACRGAFSRTAAVLVALAICGCSTTREQGSGRKSGYSFTARYERYEPSILDLAKERSSEEGSVAYQITDIDVFTFSENVKSTLRRKFTNARFARYTSASLQVLLATAAGAGAFLSGGATLVGSLALTSAVVPQLGGIFNARSRAETYQDAVRLIEEAQVAYLLSNDNSSPSGTRLTRNGILLYQKVTGTIQLVEKVITGQLPTLKEMKAATTGELAVAPGESAAALLVPAASTSGAAQQPASRRMSQARSSAAGASAGPASDRLPTKEEGGPKLTGRPDSGKVVRPLESGSAASGEKTQDGGPAITGRPGSDVVRPLQSGSPALPGEHDVGEAGPSITARPDSESVDKPLPGAAPAQKATPEASGPQLTGRPDSGTVSKPLNQ